MPSASLVEGLAYVNWTVLVSLAVGSFTVVGVVGEATDATRGYLGFTAFCAGLLGLLALLSDLGLPATESLSIRAAPALDPLRRAALAVFAVAALAYVIAIGRRTGRRPWIVAAVAAGLAAMAIAAYGWAGGLVQGVPFVVQLAVLATVTGGALATLVLGHWYLVTPRISERPLLLAARILTAAVALQLALFVVWVSVGPGPVTAPFAPLRGSSALFVWLRLVVGLMFPLALSWMAIRTARTRSMESATGLLYIDLAAIASGTIVAAMLYFASGILV